MFYKICKFGSSRITNDVIMMSFSNTMAKFGPPRNQANYISFEMYWWELSKMYFLLNLSHHIKSYGQFCQILAFLRCQLSKYDHVTWPKKQNLKMFYFVPILHLISGKVTKFLVEVLSTSEVISQKLHGGGPPPVPLGLIDDSLNLVLSLQQTKVYTSIRFQIIS